MKTLNQHRLDIRQLHSFDEAAVLSNLQDQTAIPLETHDRIHARACVLVENIRNDGRPGLMEVFLAEYGLSTDEGVALMCLAEALLRVPDAETIDELIEDKIAPSAWGAHLGKSSSSLVNASTWALMLTGKVLQDGQGMAATLKNAVKRLGEPIIRIAVQRAMGEMGQQFVLGQTIAAAVVHGAKQSEQGYTFSYDMLGEAALTHKDADAYFTSYSDAIDRLKPLCRSADTRENPGISIKLSALHPRYEVGQRKSVMADLVPRILVLAQQAAEAGMGLNIDAEEADRLDLSLDVIEAVLSDPSLTGWHGFGVVVQAYGKRALGVIDWLHALGETLDRRIMVRLVKGAYWDTEIKLAQEEGLSGFPVFTRKAATDVSYICCAHRLLARTDRIYPQFATHNAHTVAAILEIAPDPDLYEFQRLHGMGEALHDLVHTTENTRCRIYAPVGTHRDLLAYLVRRLLENGANSSFVNQIVDLDVPPKVIAADPFAQIENPAPNAALLAPSDLYLPERQNSKGWDLRDIDDLREVDSARDPFRDCKWKVGPVLAAPVTGGEHLTPSNPARPGDMIGTVTFASDADIDAALANAQIWQADATERAATLIRASTLFEQHFGEIFAMLTREAGKSPADAVSELREAVDFLRYYAARATELDQPSRGVITCISPWNFPLAIFTGQIAAALAAGNGVLAKPAETTPLIAGFAVRLLHQARVPVASLQLLPGYGATVGARLTSDPAIKGVCFTGSTATAQYIDKAMAANLDPTALLIAETGGINAMIVDSTALPEQAVQDIIDSSFQSAGQRCSALRMLYVQEDVAPVILEMLSGAMDTLVTGDPWDIATDVGPVIDQAAQTAINAYISTARITGKLIKQISVPDTGCFVGPALIRVDGISSLTREIFGPVLHVATYKAEELDSVVDAINDTGYGLTFGMHSRIDDRVQQVSSRLKIGNIYINRNQIGAVVGSQPFGGEGLSGTGPKAGGPRYVARFTNPGRNLVQAPPSENPAKIEDVQRLIDIASKQAPTLLDAHELPGPTGESNRLSSLGRGVILCLGPDGNSAAQQAKIVRNSGCYSVQVAPGADTNSGGIDGYLSRDALTSLRGISGVAIWGSNQNLRAARIALSLRDGPLIPLLAEDDLSERCKIERHICVDTTAAGGNSKLMAQSD